MGFDLVGLEFTPVGQVRVPTARVTTVTRLNVFDDHAGNYGALQTDPIDAAVPTPEALHHAQVFQRLGLSQLQNEPIDFILLHGAGQSSDQASLLPVDSGEEVASVQAFQIERQP